MPLRFPSKSHYCVWAPGDAGKGRGMAELPLGHPTAALSAQASSWLFFDLWVLSFFPLFSPFQPGEVAGAAEGTRAGCQRWAPRAAGWGSGQHRPWDSNSRWIWGARSLLPDIHTCSFPPSPCRWHFPPRDFPLPGMHLGVLFGKAWARMSQAGPGNTHGSSFISQLN